MENHRDGGLELPSKTFSIVVSFCAIAVTVIGLTVSYSGCGNDNDEHSTEAEKDQVTGMVIEADKLGNAPSNYTLK